MAEEKSETVKASIKIKNGTLQLEGPQEFVEKYLRPVLKSNKPFSKAFPKPKPMKKKQDKTRQLEKATANDKGLLSAGLFTAAAWEYGISKDSMWAWIGLIVIGVIFTISSLYFLCINRFISNEKRQNIINWASTKRINLNHLAWCFGLILLGKELIQTQVNWLGVPGPFLMYVGLFVSFLGICKATKALIQKNPQNVSIGS